MISQDQLLNWIEKKTGFETYKGLEDRSLQMILPFFKEYIDAVHNLNIKIVTIGGTNGKGETCYQISEMLTQAIPKISYTRFLSPHVHEINERISDGTNITNEELFDLFLLLDEKTKMMNIHLSFFEFLFACFLEYSLQKKPQVLILEVGVGGRLDATNLFDADIMAIISIARDHQELLGSRLENILFEKCGIARSHKPLFTCFSSQYLKSMMNLWSREKNWNWIDLIDEGFVDVKDHFSIKNRKVAKTILLELQKIIPFEIEEKKENSLSFFPGRGERKNIILNNDLYELQFYGSHNVDGVRQLVAKMSLEPKLQFILMSFSKRSFSDIKSMIAQLFALFPLNPKLRIIITTFDGHKAWMPLQEELDWLKVCEEKFCQKIIFFHSWRSAEVMSKIEEWSRDLYPHSTKKNLLITGSYYFVGQVSHYYSGALSFNHSNMS